MKKTNKIDLLIAILGYVFSAISLIVAFIPPIKLEQTLALVFVGVFIGLDAHKLYKKIKRASQN